MRWFNTTGPVVAEEHYCIPPLERLDREEVLGLVRTKRYFVLHAPRQTGKTSTLLALRDLLNESGQYRCVYINVEAGQAAREDVETAMRTILDELGSRARSALRDDLPDTLWPRVLERSGPHGALRSVLVRWSEADPKPLVLLIDEIDTLVGDTLISVLRQLRSGYDRRPRSFPQSVVLCGVRDVRDYRIHSSTEKAVVTGGSAFNIRAESLRLGDFTEAEVRALLAQHTAETGQAFTEAALATVWSQTRGQPWLVNALADESCFSNDAGRNRSRAISAETVMEARERLIVRRETHLHQLADKLREERVRRVVEPLLSGEEAIHALRPDDLEYVRDLGLVSLTGPADIANPIYREVIPRELLYAEEAMIPQHTAWYVAPDGTLDVIKLLAAFQAFFREHSEHWVERFEYKEAGPQLLLQAFLHRIVNGGGRIEREYGLGRRRTDLLIVWPQDGAGAGTGKGSDTAGGTIAPRAVGGTHRGTAEAAGTLDTAGRTTHRYVIECKVLRKGLERTIAEGVMQTLDYMDRCGAEAGHLVVFDRTEGRTWEEKLFRREESLNGRTITVWGM